MPIKIEQFFSNPQIKLFSFDVFDTIVTRKTGDHRSIFFLLGQRLRDKQLISISPELFAQQRNKFEMRARRNNNWREISFRDIYEEMFFSVDFNADIECLMEEEMRIEKEQIALIPGADMMLNKVREKYGRVIFVSDMYLPNSFLAGHLADLGCFKKHDTLYVSSDFRLNKMHGLFTIVLDKENLQPHELYHFGDSQMHDVDSAKKAGVSVHHCRYALENPSEKVLNKNFPATEAYTARMAGAARFARLRGEEGTTGEKTMWDTGASVTGPFVYLYAQWVIEQAVKKGISTLLFLARDAYFPYKAVELLLAQQPEIEINLRYIYGSRFTYNALTIDKIEENEWEQLITVSGYRYSTVRDLHASLYCDKPTFLNHINKLGIGEQDWDRQLKRSELNQIRSLALEDEQFNTDILEGVKSFQALTYEYFKNGESEKGKAALVDTGWTTNSHYPLYTFLKKNLYPNLNLFYVGMTSRQPKIPLEDVNTFLFNVANDRGLKRKDVNYNRAVESLFLTNHGRTRSFKKVNGSIEAVLDPVENQDFIQKYFDLYKGGIMAFLKEMAPHFMESSPFHDHRFVAEAIIRRFWKDPTEEEARLWSQLEWESDPLGNNKHPLASPYRLKDAWTAFKEGKTPENHLQFWRGGAEMITPKKEKYVIGKAISARNFLGRVVKKLPGGVRTAIYRTGNKILENR